MTNPELVDSKRFCAFMDELVAAWPKADDAARVGLLDRATTWFTGAPVEAYTASAPVVITEPKKKRGRPKKVVAESPDKAARLAEMNAPLSAEEKARYAKQAQAEAAKVRDPQLVVNDAVAEVIKPNWATSPSVEGFKHFLVHANRKGENVSFEPEKWLQALRLHGLPAANISFKPEGLGMSPGSLETGRGANAWRVIVG